MIKRILAHKIRQVARKFPIVAITGPRQSGKSTLARACFQNKPYVTLEDLDTRQFALDDPRRFLEKYSSGAIFDEAQRAPGLFSYLQGRVDEDDTAGRFVLTGSQNFLLLQNLSQTLAGRVSIQTLLPFSLEEIKGTSFAVKNMDDTIFKGFYPRIHDKKIDPRDWFPVYIRTYIERDVRQIKNIDNLSVFQKFIKFCASRTGQLLNLSSLANDCGITHNTAKSWIGILEASFIVFLLQPHYKNYKKRLVKAPKLYFYDTGLACALLGIESKKELESHPLRGSLFETMVISELLKGRLNEGRPPNLYFWRDKTGHELDCLIEKGNDLIAVEIKSGQTLASDSFRALDFWKALSGVKRKPFLVYGGEEDQERTNASVLSWRHLTSLLEIL